MKIFQDSAKQARNTYFSHPIASQSHSPRVLLQTTDSVISPPLTQFPKVTTAKCEEFFNHFSHLIIKRRRQSYKCLPHHVKYLACPKLVPLFTHFRCHEILFLHSRFLAHLVFKMCFIHTIEPNILSIINSYLSSATFPSNLLKKSTL